MWARIKELFKKPLFNIFLIFVLAALVLYLTMRDDGQQVLEIIAKVNLWGVAGIIVLMVLERLLLGWGLMKECQQSHPKYKLWQGFINSYTAGLFCNITPGASGGQIGQMFIFKKQGIPMTHSIGILWLDFIVYQSTMTVMVFILLLLRFDYFFRNYSEYFLIVILGFMVSAGIIVFLWALATLPHFYTWLTTKGFNIGVKLKLIRNPEESMKKLNDALTAFSKEIVVLSTHKKMIGQLIFQNVMRLLIYYSIPYFCALALNLEVGPEQLLNIIALSSFVAMVNAFLPMPGSSGGTEATFVLMFSTIFGTVDAKSIMLLWRLVTFYQTLLIGGVVFMVGKSLPDVPIDDAFEPRTYDPSVMERE